MLLACGPHIPIVSRVLIIEGGGMRGAYSNGVLSAFEEAEHNSWDAIYGTSVGGALAAWYAAGQSRYAEETWRYIVDRRFLSYRRLLRGGVLLDHEALLDIVYEHEHPLDKTAVAGHAAPVIVTASDVDSGQAHYQDIRKGPLIPWLKATGRLPIGAGPPVAIDGRHFLDGGIVDPIPLRRAIAEGATDITLVLNKPQGPPQPDNAIVAKYVARRYPMLAKAILEHQRIKHGTIALAMSPPEGVRVRIVRPQRPTGLHRLSRDLKSIRAGIEQGRQDGRRFVAAS
jgi:predicted patatin/cPLA2 family phospholipase